MSLDVKVGVKAAGDIGGMTREEKETHGLVPQPINIPGRPPAGPRSDGRSFV